MLYIYIYTYLSLLICIEIYHISIVFASECHPNLEPACHLADHWRSSMDTADLPGSVRFVETQPCDGFFKQLLGMGTP